MLRPTMNPYRYAMGVIFDRLRWDLTFESFRSRRKLKLWKDRHPLAKAIIVCNGPSLLATNLQTIGSIFSFGLNKINLLFDKNDFRPSAIVAINRFVIEQNADYFNETHIPLFLHGKSRELVKPRDNVTFLHASYQPRLARDCSISMHEGFTVTVAAMQLAFHMGFRDVAVIGCDHNFAQKGPSNQIVKSGDTDPSHFDPKYFSGGQKWQLPDLAASEYYYSLASDMFQSFGGRVVNCTVGGKLEIFQRMDLQEWISDNSITNSTLKS